MKELLLVSIGFSPNIGGIETHFDNLVGVLDKKDWKVWVLTYKPITTNVGAPFYEKRGKRITIFRIPWFGKLFYKLVRIPALEFLYLIPGLFIALPLFLVFKGSKLRVIDSHGLAAGFVSVFWGKIFGKKVITTTHSIYNFPKKGLYRKFATWIFGSSDRVLTLSKQSRKEISGLGVPEKKTEVFTYWIDINKFKRISNARKKLWPNKNFVVLFIGRLVPEKGVNELLQAAGKWDKNITLAIAGTGPLEENVQTQSRDNLIYLGSIGQDRLPLYYSASDLLVIPSTHEEGFGRVILESLACGTPVLASRRGAIPEAMDESVGKFIEISPKKIKEEVEYFYNNKDILLKLSKNCRSYAEKKYSERNSSLIIKAFSALV